MAKKGLLVLTPEQLSKEISVLRETIEKYRTGEITGADATHLSFKDAVVTLRYLRVMSSKILSKGRKDGH